MKCIESIYKLMLRNCPVTDCILSGMHPLTGCKEVMRRGFLPGEISRRDAGQLRNMSYTMRGIKLSIVENRIGPTGLFSSTIMETRTHFKKRGESEKPNE